MTDINIQSAKKTLEKMIISKAYFSRIGTHSINDVDTIVVGITEEKYTPEVESLLTEGKWDGFPVQITTTPISNPY